MARRLLAAPLTLGPLAVALDRMGAAGNLTLFPLAAVALVPLAWLIGEATEQAARSAGAGIGGFLNASFGNAPELIIALVAVSDGLTDVVRASLTGSVVGNLLLVLGFVLLVGRRGTIDRVSAFVSLGTVALAVLLLVVAAVPSFHGDPDREMRLAMEIGLASASQVAGFLIPVVTILSWAIDPLALSLRPIALASGRSVLLTRRHLYEIGYRGWCASGLRHHPDPRVHARDLTSPAGLPARRCPYRCRHFHAADECVADRSRNDRWTSRFLPARSVVFASSRSPP